MQRRAGTNAKRRLRRRLFLECLENRRLLVATDLASISGLVFDDFTGNGYDPGEEVANATLTLHRDNGDGIFQQGTDTQVSSTTTLTDGTYKFGRISAGGYFVLQDAQTASGSTLLRNVSPLISFSADDVAGMIVTPIDTFNQTTQLVNDPTTNSPVSSSVAAPEVIGGERDIYVNLTSDTGVITMNANDTTLGLGGLLSFGSGGNGAGERRVSWDGIDGDAANIQDTGLGQTDLTNNSDALGLQLQIGADLPGGEVAVRLYSDDAIGGSASRFSTATLAIPQTGGSVSQKEFIPFTSFQPTSGGGADFTQVGAIELEILTGAANVDGQADIVGTVGETNRIQDFENFEQADLSLTKTVDDATPSLNQQVNFLITLSNAGPDAATGVEVRDQLPAGVNFVSAVASQGSYNNATGIWTVGSVNSGLSPTLQLRGTVTSAGSRINTAEVTASDQFDPNSTPGNGNPSENDQASVSFVTEAIDLALTKIADPTTVVIGNNVSFTLTLTNAGPSNATGVIVEDQLPTGISFVSSTPSQGSYVSSTGLWNVGTVASSGTATLTLVGRVDAPGEKTNIAQVFAADQEDINSTPGNNDPNENDQDSATIAAPQINLSLTKGASPTTVVVGENVTFTIMVSNAGPNEATGVTVLDQLPSGVAFVSSNATQGTYNSSTGIWNIGAISVGGSRTLTITANVTAPGQKINTAQVQTADQPDSDSTPGNGVESENDQDSVTIEAPQIDLELTKTAVPTSVVVGEQVEFTISLTTQGPSEATGVVVKDFLPTGISFIGSSASRGSYNVQNGLWTVGTVGALESPTLTLTGRVDTPGEKTNTAQVQAADQPDIDSTPGNDVEEEDDQDSVTILAPQIDLALVKSVDNNMPDVGETITFTLDLSNAGPDIATGVRVRDLLPTGLDFVSHSTLTGSYNAGTGIWNVGTVPANESVSLEILAVPTTTAMIANITEVVAADQPDASSTPDNNDPSENDQSSVIIGAQQIDLELTKTVDNPTPNVNDTITFSIEVNNDGPSDATGVVVQDQLPDGLTLTSSTTTAGNYNPSTGQWTIGGLANQTTQTLTLLARVDSADMVVNTAEVIAADQVDRDSVPGNGVEEEDDQDSAVVNPQIADLSLTKSVNNPRPNVGETTTFTITVSNMGPDAATNVSVADRLPTGLAFDSVSASQGDYDATTGAWVVGTIGAGGQASLDIVALVESSNETVNTAQVSASDQFDPNSTPNNNVESEDDQDSVTITPPVIDLELNKSIDIERPNFGQTIRYTVTVDNQGPDDASGVIVADDFPDGLVFVASTATSGNYDVNTGRWTVGAISANSTATLTIDATVNTVETTTNVAEVFAADQFDSDSTPGNSNPNEDDYSSVTFELAVADLSLTKEVDETTPNVGDNVTFTIETTNAGIDPATGVTVLDMLPEGLDFVSSSQTIGNYNSSSGIWNIGDLDANQTATLTIVATSTTNTPVINVARVESSDQLDPNSTPGNDEPGEDDQDSIEVTGQLIDLSLEKSADNPRPNVGDTVRFTIELTNSEISRATGVSVRDVLPEGLEFVNSSATRGNYDDSTGIWTVGTVNSGDLVTLNISASTSGVISVVNTAEVITADQPDIDSTPDNGDPLEDDQDSVEVITQVADLSLTKSVDNERPDVGKPIVFRIDLVNDGPDPATNVRVADTLPEGLRFISSEPSLGTYNPTTGIWNVGEVGSKEDESLLITAEVLTIGVKVNSAEVVSADQADPNSTPGNNVPTEDDQDSVSVQPTIIDLSLEKTARPFRPSVNGELTYTITLKNDGIDTATGVVVEDTLPPSVTLLTATPSVGVFSNGEWSVSSLAPATDATLELLVRVDEPGEPENRAQVIAADQFDFDSTPGNDDGIDGNGNDEDDQASVTVTTASADLSLTKIVSNERPPAGSEQVYTVTLSNAGPDTAKDVVVLDQLPTGLTFVSATTSAGDYNQSNNFWTVPSIAEGVSETLELRFRVTSLGEKINTAQVIASSEFDPNSTPGNNDPDEDDQDSVSLVPELVDLALTKVVDDATPNVGGTVRFTLEVTNQGPSTATGVVVADQLPPGMTATEIIASEGVYDPVNGIWDIGTVLKGSRPMLEIDARIDQPDPQINVAEIINADQPDIDSTPGNGDEDEDDYASVEVTPQIADLRLIKTVSDPTPNNNEEVFFTIIVGNEGPNDATNVLVRDLLPKGMTFERANESSGTYDPINGLWTIPEVRARSVASLQLVSFVQTKDPVTNTAEIIASDQFDPDSTPDNQDPTEDDIDSASLTPRLIDLSITATAENEQPNPGELFEMIFTATNDGPDEATNVIVDIDLPAGLTLISARPQRGTFNSPWNIPRLAAGETVSLVITARAETRGTKVVEAEVIAADQADVDSTPGNNQPQEDDQTTLLIRVPVFSKRLFLARR
ncbi:MAG: DUF11 domain-containing protein [Rubripirellula sp.]|nr:DUF11 domain-containing protein [Rubripirellula sp.]